MLAPNERKIPAAVTCTDVGSFARHGCCDVCDCGPFPPIVREAGGYFGDWQGNETIYGNEAISTTPTLLLQVLALVGSEPSIC